MRRSLALLALIGTVAAADENEWFVPLGLPPRASPQRISAGEAVPPLPLPATPLRRTERKRQPSPPKLVGKVVWGETASFKYESGFSCTVADWNLCPGDAQQILQKANQALGVSYGGDSVSLAAFDGDPEKMPVLLFSGGRTVRFDDAQLALLRSYILRGGMIVFDSIAGSPYFYDAAKRATAAALPEYGLRLIPADHPIYHMVFDVETVRYPRNLASDRPVLEGVYVGSRIAVLISKYGLGCGWDDHEVPLISKAIYYDVESANRLGVNILSYAIGYAAAGREESKPELFGSLDEKAPTDEFVFAQIRHAGAWDVHPGGAAALLRRLRAGTALRVSLKRVAVTPGVDELASFPVLYLEGLDDFQFDARAVASLKGFFANAGTLVINNGLGLSTFDAAVRRELRRVFPDARFEPIPATHPLYSSVFKIGEVHYSPAVAAASPDLKAPALEGIMINGDLRVIYSPYDLEAGWLGCEYPLAKSLDPQSALPLGMNLVMYAMTH